MLYIKFLIWIGTRIFKIHPYFMQAVNYRLAHTAEWISVICKKRVVVVNNMPAYHLPGNTKRSKFVGGNKEVRNQIDTFCDWYDYSQMFGFSVVREIAEHKIYFINDGVMWVTTNNNLVLDDDKVMQKEVPGEKAGLFTDKWGDKAMPVTIFRKEFKTPPEKLYNRAATKLILKITLLQLKNKIYMLEVPRKVDLNAIAHFIAGNPAKIKIEEDYALIITFKEPPFSAYRPTVERQIRLTVGNTNIKEISYNNGVYTVQLKKDRDYEFQYDNIL